MVIVGKSNRLEWHSWLYEWNETTSFRWNDNSRESLFHLYIMHKKKSTETLEMLISHMKKLKKKQRKKYCPFPTKLFMV